MLMSADAVELGPSLLLEFNKLLRVQTVLSGDVTKRFKFKKRNYLLFC